MRDSILVIKVNHALFLYYCRMAELEIPVRYHGKDLLLKGYVKRYGYVQHIVVDVNGRTVTFERDEEGNYRALSDPKEVDATATNIDLMKAVINVLDAL